MVSHTAGPWTVFIDDSGDEWTGWPLCITADNVKNANGDGKLIVRTGGQWPYKWDNGTSMDEANANARLISASPDLLSAARCALGYMTGNMDGDMELGNPIEMLRSAIAKADGGSVP